MEILQFITDMVGEVPPELESLVYILGVVILLFVIRCFFDLITSVFGVTKWTRSN